MKRTKVLIAITTLGMAGASLANAQTVTANTQNTGTGIGQRMMQNLTDTQKVVLDKARTLFQSGKQTEADALLAANGIQIPKKGMGGMHGGKGMGDRKAIEDAIIAGNFATFQTVASTSPLAKIDQATFNLLTPQFQARKAANDQITTILKNVGITAPGHGPGENRNK